MVELVNQAKPTENEMIMALDLLGQWDNVSIDTDGDGFYDHPAAIIFDRWWTKAVTDTFGDEFEGYKNVFGQSAVQILSDRYHGYTLFYKALQGKTKVDYFSGRKAEILQNSLKNALSELASEQKDKKVNEYFLKTAMDSFHPVTVLGYFLYQSITSSVGSLSTFPKVDRGTENHIVALELGAIKGVNITAPGTSGFISQSGNQSKNLGDQVKMFVDFNYKPILFYRESVERSAQATVEIELR
jgi:penicillin amidase